MPHAGGSKEAGQKEEGKHALHAPHTGTPSLPEIVVKPESQHVAGVTAASEDKEYKITFGQVGVEGSEVWM